MRRSQMPIVFSASILGLVFCYGAAVAHAAAPQAAQLPSTQSAPQTGSSQWPSPPSGPQSTQTVRQQPNPIKDIGIAAPLSRRQKDAIVEENFKKTQQDVARLSKMVQALQKQMQKSNPDILSVAVWKQVNKIEKLARKIKGETRLY